MAARSTGERMPEAAGPKPSLYIHGTTQPEQARLTQLNHLTMSCDFGRRLLDLPPLGKLMSRVIELWATIPLWACARWNFSFRQGRRRFVTPGFFLAAAPGRKTLTDSL